MEFRNNQNYYNLKKFPSRIYASTFTKFGQLLNVYLENGKKDDFKKIIQLISISEFLKTKNLSSDTYTKISSITRFEESLPLSFSFFKFPSLKKFNDKFPVSKEKFSILVTITNPFSFLAC